MNDYCIGIAYATGYFANDDKVPYLVVRNLDKWYVQNISNATGYKIYESLHNIERDGRSQYVVKARNVHTLPKFHELQNENDFCRAYIEIHGILDMATAKRRNGTYFKKPRLRIYGSEAIITYINNILPAKEKKIQFICTKVHDKYIGNTCAIYYQSKTEIISILEWIEGSPKNIEIWEKWNANL